MNTKAFKQSNNLNVEQINSLLKESELKLTEPVDKSPVIFKIRESEVGTLGNFSSSNGKPKSRKSFSASALAAAGLTGEKKLEFSVNLPSEKPVVLVIDTEQSRYHCHKTLSRIACMCNNNQNEHPNNLVFLSLRKYAPEIRMAIIEQKIKVTPNLGLVILDGVRDLAYDINSPEEATYIITKLMQWTDEGNFHLHAIIHQNKADSSSRGHLGTELNNKSESVIEINKDSRQEENSIVKGTFLRDIDFVPFAFTIETIEGLKIPTLIEDYEPTDNDRLKKNKWDPLTWEPEALRLLVKDCYMNLANVGLTYASLVTTITKVSGMGISNAKKFVTFLVSKKLVEKKERSYYQVPT